MLSAVTYAGTSISAALGFVALVIFGIWLYRCRKRRAEARASKLDTTQNPQSEYGFNSGVIYAKYELPGDRSVNYELHEDRSVELAELVG